jgi:hypothetical protein
MTAALGPIRRILLALDAGNETGVLEAVALLAARLDAELAAVFVEDEELLRLAALPFARELGLSSAVRRPLRDRDLERTLRARAERSQAALAAAATRTHVRWSFRVTRGRIATCVTAAATEADLVTFSVAGDPLALLRRRTLVQQTLVTCARPVLLLPAGAELGPPYVVLFDGSDAGSRALHLAARLAGGQDTVRVLLVAAPGDVARRRAAAEAALAENGVAGAFRTLPALTAADIAHAVRREVAGTVLLPVAGDLLVAGRAGRLPGDFGCATLLVP